MKFFQSGPTHFLQPHPFSFPSRDTSSSAQPVSQKGGRCLRWPFKVPAAPGDSCIGGIGGIGGIAQIFGFRSAMGLVVSILRLSFCILSLTTA